MRLVVKESISQTPYWMSFSELTPNHNCITGYSTQRDPQRAKDNVMVIAAFRRVRTLKRLLSKDFSHFIVSHQRRRRYIL
jgi:hypothetical protein